MALADQNAGMAAMCAFRKNALAERMKQGVEVSAFELTQLSKLEVMIAAREAAARLQELTREVPVEEDPEAGES